MRKILVLDAFTNGHEAAMAFVKKHGWPESECEVVFCGTHAKLLQRLSEGSAFAVVPVRNSIAGEVTEVTNTIDQLLEKGYCLVVRDSLDLQINHCLLVPKDVADPSQDVVDPSQLERVMSHEKAIQQCGKYLDSIGVTLDRRSKRDSTGNAAKVISRIPKGMKMGAIASKAAAQEYGLKILAENIQDVPDNKTTFLLLENKAEVESVTVGIIGINGGFGQMLKRFFEGLGCWVIGSGKRRPTGFTNAQVVEKADVVVFSVLIKETVNVIKEVLPYAREDQLFMDVTSVKQGPVAAMLESRAQVLGLHPMFRPEVSFYGQTVVACPARLTMPRWKTWAVNMLAATGSKIKWSIPKEHDNYMTTVQVMPHLGNLASALLITREGTSVSESLAFTSPFYRIMFSQMGRLISQDPGLYASIVMENPQSLQILEKRIEIERQLADIIRRQDHQAFEQLFVEARAHFGKGVVQEANELFTRLIGVLNTLYGRNSVTLEFSRASDSPGLLERILRVFDDHQVNLTGINSVFLDGKLQFAISFEQSRSSDGVRRALEKIESWSEPRVNLIG